MLTAIALIGLVFVAAVAVRRAAALAIAVAVGWAVWSMSRDLWAGLAAGAIALPIAAGVMDLAARTNDPPIRRLSVGLEILAASTLAGWLTFLALQGNASELTLFLVMALAAIVGAGLVLGRRQFA